MVTEDHGATNLCAVCTAMAGEEMGVGDSPSDMAQSTATSLTGLVLREVRDARQESRNPLVSILWLLEIV